MVLLIFGLALWWAGHLYGRILPDLRSRLGKSGRGVSAVVILLGVLCMVFGFRVADVVPLYPKMAWAVHLNNLLVLIAFYLFAVAGAKTRLHRIIRHPQLTGFSIWAVAHLLVNGDLASWVMFGGLLVWALTEMVLINRAQPDWERPPVASKAKEIRAAAIALVLYAVVAAIHSWLGYFPFG
ncbi:NnrU family protein [Qingshengfaniella alkalisoli]|uniref:NnrU domain-containing protein n=1 Tax=Qingshengfaniella alkalisoli TaxID=2599296 RepID=A0A5B8I767_9RHOB|nr:NnrU family protein [Qingshengfaniella alkalisoli]QDY68396.1 hypothetical protein FPZ52_01355 [Qingshengfaniella alkalisoli]